MLRAGFAPARHPPSISTVLFKARIPCEAHAKLGGFTQNFRLYNTGSRFSGSQASASLGIDNLNNYQYWNFHPYPQRTFMAELKLDL